MESHIKPAGEIVAVTGSGANDGPVLRMADVGFTMASPIIIIVFLKALYMKNNNQYGSFNLEMFIIRCISCSVSKLMENTCIYQNSYKQLLVVIQSTNHRPFA